MVVNISQNLKLKYSNFGCISKLKTNLLEFQQIFEELFFYLLWILSVLDIEI